MDEVTAIDLGDRKVVNREHEERYDYLVPRHGGEDRLFRPRAWEAHARGLKSLDDATAIRRDVLLAFEKAEACEDPAERERLMTVVVIGGGPPESNSPAAFAELARHVLKRDFKNINTSEARILLIEAQDGSSPCTIRPLGLHQANFEGMGSPCGSGPPSPTS